MTTEQAISILRNTAWLGTDKTAEQVKVAIDTIDNACNKGELKQHLLELSCALDEHSAGKDYVALRRAHYDNIEWLHEHGLTGEYYEVLFAHFKGEE